MAHRVSLLHATYHRPHGPADVRDTWLAAANDREHVEYIVAMDEDDDVAIKASQHWPLRVVSPASPSVTAVRNWNAAAALATGDLLFVIADDLFPPHGWDEQLRELTGELDPRNDAFAIKVKDAEWDKDVLLRHPVVSRAFYDELGLFAEAFTGLWCDNDITMKAFWRSFIIDGRKLVVSHRHPVLCEGLQPSASQHKMNRDAEYAAGAEIFASRWPARKRHGKVRLVAAGESASRANRGQQRVRVPVMIGSIVMRYPGAVLKALLLQVPGGGGLFER